MSFDVNKIARAYTRRGIHNTSFGSLEGISDSLCNVLIDDRVFGNMSEDEKGMKDFTVRIRSFNPGPPPHLFLEDVFWYSKRRPNLNKWQGKRVSEYLRLCHFREPYHVGSSHDFEFRFPDSSLLTVHINIRHRKA